MVFVQSHSRSGLLILALIILSLVPLMGTGPTTTPPAVEAALSCTFTAEYPVVNLREGPGIDYPRLGRLAFGDTLAVIEQAAGADGFVWWQSADGWVRSDLGSSDCPATCGNTVCEYGETLSSCAQDCSGASSASASTVNLQSTGEGCVVPDSQSCYESIDCYPDCNVCDSWLNDFGCVACQCDSPADSTTTSTDGTTTTNASGCVYDTCEECIAAFPCTPGPCTKTECELNDFGCPVCSTSS
jgi:hypothetical protein